MTVIKIIKKRNLINQITLDTIIMKIIVEANRILLLKILVLIYLKKISVSSMYLIIIMKNRMKIIKYVRNLF